MGVPGRPLGKALGRILERKIGDQKKVEKKQGEGDGLKGDLGGICEGW